jgi:hypothetical protein
MPGLVCQPERFAFEPHQFLKAVKETSGLESGLSGLWMEVEGPALRT